MRWLAERTVRRVGSPFKYLKVPSRYVVGWEVQQTRKFSASSPRLQTHLNHGNPTKLTTQSQTMSGRNSQLALVIVGRHKFFSQGWSLELKRVSPAFHLYCNSQVVSGALHILRRCQGSGTPLRDTSFHRRGHKRRRL